MDKIESLVEGLTSKGWAFSDDLIPKDVASNLRREALLLHEQGDLRQAMIGQKELKQKIREIRKDKIKWIDNLHPTEPEQHYLNIITELRSHFAKRLFLALNAFEAHVATYPAGSFYKKHLDQFSTNDARQLTCILYLNEDWIEQDGGQLRIFNEKNPDQVDTEILPQMGRFVMLLSPSVYHEVLPTSRERYSVTGWMRSTDLQQDPLALVL